MMRGVNHIRGPILALGYVCVSYALVLCGVMRFPLGVAGTHDFSQYWGAWDLLRRGMNPYDGALMRAVQDGLGAGGADTTWAPPWTPILLAPVLSLPFDQAAALWFLYQLGIALFLAYFMPRAINRPDVPLLLSGLLTLFFLPVLDSLYWGQLSLLLTLSAVMFLYFEGRGRILAAGVSLVPLTLKPHLMLFLMPAVFLWWWRLTVKDRWRFTFGLIGSLSVLCLIVMTLAPQALLWWLSALLNPRSVVGAVPTVAWKTATLSTWARIILADAVRGVPIWPMICLPLTSLGAVTFFYARYRPIIRWRTTFPTITSIALLTGAYGWLYDQSLILVGMIVAAGDALACKDRKIRFSALVVVGAIEGLAIAQSLTGYNEQHYFVWIPIAVLCLLAFHRKHSRALGDDK